MMAVTDRGPHRLKWPWALDYDAHVLRNDRIREKKIPHEYEGGSICQICGLGDKAPIHVK